MNQEIAFRLVNTGKLSVEQLFEVGNKANSWRVWQAIVKKIEE